jgi:hypothetical protein
MSVPNPGSSEALAIGCRCDPAANADGRGVWGTIGPDALFDVRLGCPIHGVLTSWWASRGGEMLRRRLAEARTSAPGYDGVLEMDGEGNPLVYDDPEIVP